MTKEYKTISEIAGPLIFVEKTEPVGYNELVNINLPMAPLRGDRFLILQMISLWSRYLKAPGA